MSEERLAALRSQREAVAARLAHIDAEIAKETATVETATAKPKVERAVTARKKVQKDA